MRWLAATRRRCETDSNSNCILSLRKTPVLRAVIRVQRAGGICGLHGAQHRSTRDSAPPLVPHQVQRRISRESQGVDTFPALAASTTVIALQPLVDALLRQLLARGRRPKTTHTCNTFHWVVRSSASAHNTGVHNQLRYASEPSPPETRNASVPIPESFPYLDLCPGSQLLIIEVKLLFHHDANSDAWGSFGS